MYTLNIHLFSNTNVTTDSGLTAEMKTFYSDYLIQNAKPKLVHGQFGQKHNIPQGKGKTIEFRKYAPLPKATTPLTEGVTPTGHKLDVSTVTANIKQFGDYVEISDMLQLTAIDNNLTEAIELQGPQSGGTIDTVQREVLNAGTSVIYANGKDDRSELEGGSATAANNCYLSVLDVRKAVRYLKQNNAEKVDGFYRGIINPDCAFDLMNDSEWKYPHQYVDTKNIYEGEIGEIAGVRFVETTEAKVFHAKNLAGDVRNLTVASYATKVVTIDEALTAAEAAALKGRLVMIKAELCEIASATAGAAGAATFTLKDTPTITPADGDVVYPGEAGKNGRDVYSTLIIGKNAYGVSEVDGGGLQFIVKQLGEGDDPLNQRATAGWKATAAACILVETFMVRIESTSTYEAGEN